MDEPDYIRVTRRTYDTVAGTYVERFADELDGRPLERALLTAFEEMLDDGDVLDLGCGPGHIGAFVHALARGPGRPGRAVTGVDLSPAMIELAAERFPELQVRVGDMLALDLPDASFAGVTAFYSIIHLPTEVLPRVFAEVHRVLSPGGRVLLAFQTGDGTPTVREDDDWLGHTVSLSAWWRPPDVVTGLLEDAGLHPHAQLHREANADEGRPRAYVFAQKAPREPSRSVM